MDISFFKENNKSGYKTREKWLIKNEPLLYNNIIEYSLLHNITYSFKEKIWFYFNNLTERPKCATCGNDIQFRDRFDKPYGDFCSLKCINENKSEMIKRQKKSFNEKYNINFYPQHPDFINKRKKTKLKLYNDENFNNHTQTKLTKRIRYSDSNYNNLDKYKKTCLEKYGVNNYLKTDEYKNILHNVFIEKYNNLEIINYDSFYVYIKCNICNNEFKITKKLLHERNKANQTICTICNNIGQSHRSSCEVELTSFLDDINVTYIKSDRKILKKYEIDIFIPSHNLAIELNGVYWHNELFVNDKYHLNKTIQCKSKNIDLIHIFEDEWKNKKEIIKSMIKKRLQINIDKIYAINCDIKPISQKESKLFLENNHIQGYVNSKVRLGLFHNKELVSVMIFSNHRKNEWELIRFANLINKTVIDGASKLFTFFKNTFEYDKIIFYSDVRLFNESLYEKLNFIKKSQSKPNYWYVLNGKRYHRFKYRKSALIKDGFDPNKTEREIMFERKIYRIYDCGNIILEYNKK